MRMICRNIICHLVLVSLEKECLQLLKTLNSTNRDDERTYLNQVRFQLYRLMRRLQAKTAESNMLRDYQHCYQFIHDHTIKQLIEWQGKDIRSSSLDCIEHCLS
jgi:hypothetical protein